MGAVGPGKYCLGVTESEKGGVWEYGLEIVWFAYESHTLRGKQLAIQEGAVTPLASKAPKMSKHHKTYKIKSMINMSLLTERISNLHKSTQLIIFQLKIEKNKTLQKSSPQNLYWSVKNCWPYPVNPFTFPVSKRSTLAGESYHSGYDMPYPMYRMYIRVVQYLYTL